MRKIIHTHMEKTKQTTNRSKIGTKPAWCVSSVNNRAGFKEDLVNTLPNNTNRRPSDSNM